MNINEMLKRAKKIQAEASKAEAELNKKEFIIEKQGIKVTMLGSRKLTNIEINPVLIDPDDPDLLQSMIMIAINEANEIINEAFDELSDKYQTPGLPM